MIRVILFIPIFMKHAIVVEFKYDIFILSSLKDMLFKCTRPLTWIGGR